MTVLTNFKEYIPEHPDKQFLKDNLNVVFIKSDEGVDWYESQKLFKDDLLKIMFDAKTGVIIATTKDVTALWPNGYSVADIEYDLETTPESLEGRVFQMRTGLIVDRVYTTSEQKSIVQRKIASLQKQATTLMAPLQAAKELDMMTEQEAAYYKELQRYLVLLSRIPTQEGYPTTIEWPTLPKA